MNFYTRKSARHRAILDISLGECWLNQKRQTREIYKLLREQNYSVAGYKNQLELALDYVNRSLAAIEALEKAA